MTGRLLSRIAVPLSASKLVWRSFKGVGFSKRSDNSALRAVLIFFGLMIFSFVMVVILILVSDRMVPRYLAQMRFEDQRAVFDCTGTYRVQLSSQKTVGTVSEVIQNDKTVPSEMGHISYADMMDETAFFVGKSAIPLSDFCDKEVVFSGQFHRWYQQPLCAGEVHCGNKAAVVLIEKIEIAQ